MKSKSAQSLTRDQEAGLIIEKLTKTDAERQREKNKISEEEILAALSEEIADELDREILQELQSAMNETRKQE